MNDKKILIIIGLITTIILIAGVIFLGNSPTKEKLESVAGVRVEVVQQSYDFKDISYSGGNAVYEFPIKNNGEKELVIANMSTSCMCTTVALKTAGLTSPEFGMAGHSPVSSWKGTVKPGEDAKIVVTFDPTAHGPSGVGPVSRFISFETNDPDHPYVELSIIGNVVK